jgi:hypothetical protein
MSVLMTPESEVRHYRSGYLDGIVVPPEHSDLFGGVLLQDILVHYKRLESFRRDDYESLDLSQTAFQYIEAGEKSGQINSAAKHFIQAGRI